VVRDLPPLAGVYPDLADGLPEDLWRVDLATGQRERVGSLPSGVNAERIFTSPDGTAVYVVDRTTGRLYTVPVEPSQP
jgi:sugar lactone lactonase YvrE